MKGTVKWFDSEKGYGFIVSDEDQQKEYFVHFSEIQKSGFKSLLPEQKVEFEIKKDNQGRDQAVNVKEI